ncbi:hypothetical protein GTU99_28690, partial [Streptomyces sp. PRKS01-65]|nr:hypothetical protein [Streptomyces harenosi]
MTQSGQGEQPSAGPAREGIVLPSDGGGPLLPGQGGAPGPQPWDGAWAPEQQAPAPGTPGHPQAPAPGGPAQDWQAAPAQPWGHP